MTTLLIAGSRDATPQMVQYARAAVWRARAVGFQVIGGDALGIDSVVALEAKRAGALCHVVGIAPAPRHGHGGANYTQFVPTASTLAARYLERDAYMIECADLGIFIWNGVSRGTRAGFERMNALNGKQAWLVDSKGKQNHENCTR